MATKTGTEIGKAYVKIMPSAEGIASGVSSVLNKDMPTLGTSAGKMLGASLKIAFASGGAGLGKIIHSSISEGAKLQQSLGGVQTLFKENADKVIAYANQAYKTAGVSANTYMENVTSFSASLLQSLGKDTGRAAEVANMAMIDMADNSNKMGTSMESIQYAYQGFAKQNYIMLDNLKLGYGGTKSEMERLLADAQKLTGVQYNIDNLSDVYTAIHIIQKELDITGTTAIEGEKTFSGSMAKMSASASNFLGNLSLGEDVKPFFKALLDASKTFFVGNLLPMVANSLSGLGDLIVSGFDAFAPDFKNQLTELGTMVTQSLDFNGVQTYISSFVTAFSSGVQTMFSGFMPHLETASLAFTNLWNACQPVLSIIADGLQSAFNILGSFLGGFFAGALDAITVLFNILQFAISALTPVVAFLVDVIKFFEPVLTTVAYWIGYVCGYFSTFGQVTQWFGKLFSTVSGNIQTAFGKTTNFLKSCFDNLKFVFDWFRPILNFLGNAFSTVFSSIGKVVSFAQGHISKVFKVIEIAFKALSSVFVVVGGKIGDAIKSICNMFDNLAKINLFDAGKAILEGFFKGLKSAWKAVTDFIGGIAGWIAKHKGPISYDKRLLIPAGKAIMNGLNDGLVTHFQTVKQSVSGMATEIENAMLLQPTSTSSHINFTRSVQDDLDKTMVNLTHGKTKQQKIDVSQKVDNVLDLLQKLLDKETDVYLDSEKVGRVMYEDYARRFSRERFI